MKLINNKETLKLELHFSKEEYLKLPEQDKNKLKSNFLFSKSGSCWVSRCKYPNLYRAEKAAKELGAGEAETKGEILSYAERLNAAAEKAENRAERYETYAGNAVDRAKTLQSDFNKYRKDWSWLTQPIIAGHAGSRAFANHRNKVIARYERGMQEYKKSDYYKERAETARATADNAKLTDKRYLHNRIKECKKNLKKTQEYIVKLENTLYRIQQGEELKNYRGETLTEAGTEDAIQKRLEYYEFENDKLEFFEDTLESLGGVQFNKDNIKPGYIVEIKGWGACEIVSTGPVNVSFKVLSINGFRNTLTDPYEAITKIIKEVKPEEIKNPYKENDILCLYNMGGTRIIEAYQVIKVTEKGISIQEVEIEDNKPIKDAFKTGSKAMRKGITKSKYSDFVGAYHRDRMLNKYSN